MTRMIVSALVVFVMTLTLTANVSATTPGLSSELMTLSQLPAGWSVDSLSGSVSAGCLANELGLTTVLVARGIKQTSNAKVFFIDDNSVPIVSEMLATYANPAAAYEKVVTQFASCKRVKGVVFGVAVTGSMSERNFTHYANASEAFSATTSIMGQTFREDAVIVRKGDVVIAVIEGSVPSVNLSQFRGLVVKALAKVR
jgi:hypothetical protein